MKRYLVKFNRPLLLKIEDDSSVLYKPVYGFFGRRYKNNEEDYQEQLQNHKSYASYLAAIHEWSNNTSPEFSISEYSAANWIDETGQEHIKDDWVLDICSRAMEKLGLDISTYVIDLDEVIGPWNRLITDEYYMDYLIHKTESQEERLVEKTVFLFNRPLWFSQHNLGEGEDGYSHIYGFVSDDELDEELKSDARIYLGYLAMCEEYILAGITPSGFSTQDAITWYKDGIEYDVKAEEILEECSICRKKHNLRFRAAVLRIPEHELEKGVFSDLITDQELYEDLFDMAMIE